MRKQTNREREREREGTHTLFTHKWREIDYIKIKWNERYNKPESNDNILREGKTNEFATDGF